MNASITQIVEELRSQLAPIEAEETRHREALAELKGHRKLLEAALSVLGSAKPKSPRRAKACATKPEVLQIIVELLRANGPMELADLEGLAKDSIREAGHSLSGFSLRFREAVQELGFQKSAGGTVSLPSKEALRSA